MKHLKSYKIFENIDNVNDIINDIKDIVIELEDEGFYVYINHHIDEDGLGQIQIKFQKNMVDGSGEIFNIYEIKECVNRILNFLSMDSRHNIDLDETTFTAIDRSYDRYENFKIKRPATHLLDSSMNDDNLLMFVVYLKEESIIT